ncbi:MAG: hypothetical protein CMJ67_07960, partial [Planctomycetaceae bacterium]|nr:hypothetical protein [Planctomycetaceae bacterium]
MPKYPLSASLVIISIGMIATSTFGQVDQTFHLNRTQFIAEIGGGGFSNPIDVTGIGDPFDHATYTSGGHTISGKLKYGSYSGASGTANQGSNFSFYHSTDFQTPASRFQWNVSGHFFNPYDGLQFGVDQGLAWLGNVSKITVSGDFWQEGVLNTRTFSHTFNRGDTLSQNFSLIPAAEEPIHIADLTGNPVNFNLRVRIEGENLHDPMNTSLLNVFVGSYAASVMDPVVPGPGGLVALAAIAGLR